MKKGFLFVLSILLALNLWAQQMHLFIQDSRTKHKLLMDMLDGQEAKDTNGVTWKLGIEVRAVADQPDAQDYRLTWTVTAGQVESVSVGISKIGLN
jgi:hypothetical protein